MYYGIIHNIIFQVLFIKHINFCFLCFSVLASFAGGGFCIIICTVALKYMWDSSYCLLGVV